MPPIEGWKTGVYCLYNKVSGKRYIGSAAVSLVRRMQSHKNALRGGYHDNPHLQRSWDKYGEPQFDFQIVERCPPRLCLLKEQHWIDHYDAANPKVGYNRRPIADSNFGLTFGLETRAKLSAVKKGVAKSEEHKFKIAEALRGKPKSPEAVAKFRARMTGRKLTEEHKRAISQGVSVNKGSVEYNQVRSRASKGKKRTAEQIEKVAAMHRGLKRSPETCARISAAKKAANLKRKLST